MRINFDSLFTVENLVMTPKVQVNILSVFRGGPEMSLSENSINGVDLLSWQGKDLMVDLRKGQKGQEYYILGLAVA